MTEPKGKPAGITTENMSQTEREALLRTTRRGFLSGGLVGTALLGTGLGTARFGQAFAQEADDEEKGTSFVRALSRSEGLEDEAETPEITARTFEEAEKLFNLSYTPEEREQLLGVIEDHIQTLGQLRALSHPNPLQPAQTFDPRLPGHAYADQTDGVRTTVRPGRKPGSASDVAYAPLTHLSEWVRTKQISSSELTEIYLDRIDRYAPTLQNFVTVTADLARKQAQQADSEIAAGQYRGPLHGIPYGLKDLMDTEGILTSWGATPYRDRIAQEDAVIVDRLQDAGAVLLGKTTNGAIAYGDIWFDGVTRNPWNINEGSSGSSAGSASATASALCGFSIGTETLGSIISPSTRCGTTGLRPTFGRVPRNGTMALCWSLDKIGPICRSVEDTALVLSAINGAHSGDAASIDHGFEYGGGDPSGLKVGFDPAWFEEESATEVDRNALEALKRTGVEMVEMSLPDWPYGSLIMQLEAEAAAAFEELTLSNRDDQMVWQEPQAWPNTWRKARFLSAVDLIQIDRFRRKIMLMMHEKFHGLDAMFSPNFAGSLLLITNYTGHPALTVRSGFIQRQTRTLFNQERDATEQKHRVPQTTTLWGPMFEERKLLTIGRALETELGVSSERPPRFA